MQNLSKYPTTLMPGYTTTPTAIAAAKDRHRPIQRPPRDKIDPGVWERVDMRQALASRDMQVVYRILQRYGVSQRVIAAATGQSQSEVSEIISGRRRVASYELLVRIAEGLNIPRGWMGLAYDDPADQGGPARGGVA